MEADNFLFIRTVLTGLSFVAGLAGLVLILLEFGRQRGRGRLHAWLAAWWRLVEEAGWGDLAARYTRAFVYVVDSALSRFFVNADKGTVLTVFFVALMFVLIPAAALLNLLIGGNPFLAKYYLSLVAVFVVLNFTGEHSRLTVINGAAALYLGASVFVLIPLYVFRSFATVPRIDVFPHAVFESLLVAPLCYLVAFGVRMITDTFVFRHGPDGGHSIGSSAFYTFLAALPVSFVLTFAALLVGGITDPMARASLSWQYLLSCMVFASAGLTVTAFLLAWAARSLRPLALSAAYLASITAGGAFSWAVLYVGSPSALGNSAAAAFAVLLGRDPLTGQLFFGAEFWVMHLPLLPVVVLCIGLFVAGLAKVVSMPAILVLGPRFAAHRPFLMTGVLCAVLVVLSWWVAANL